MGVANALNINQSGIVGFDGVSSFQGSPMVQYELVFGGSTPSTLQQLGSLGTLGQVLTSRGPASLPDWEDAAGGGIVLTGDSGTATGSNITLYSNQATSQAGASVAFVNSGTTSTFEVTDPNNNTLIGYQSGPTAGGAYKSNTGVGAHALGGMSNNAAATDNTAIGLDALQHMSTGSQNVACGSQCLTALTTGTNNTAIGYGAFGYITTGSSNIGIGDGAGYLNNSGGESGNIYLGSYGVGGESNAMRLGLDGVTSTAYMSGVNGVTVSNPLMVTMNSSTRQMGTAPIPSSPNPNQVITLVDDFCGYELNTSSGGAVASTYSWAINGVIPFANHVAAINTNPGLITHPAMPTGTSYLYLGQGGSLGVSATNATFALGAGALSIEWIFNIVTPPNGTNDFYITVGMMDLPTGSPMNWLIFQAHFGQNWQVNNSFNASTTNTDTGIAITSGWHKFSISVDAGSTVATYNLDGNIFTISPDIPTLGISPTFRIIQNSGTVAAGSVVVDLFTLTQTLTTSR